MLKFLVGVLVGVILMLVVYEIQSRGTIVIDESDPEGPYLFMEVTHGDMLAIMRSRYVVFKTKTQK